MSAIPERLRERAALLLKALPDAASGEDYWAEIGPALEQLEHALGRDDAEAFERALDRLPRVRRGSRIGSRIVAPGESPPPVVSRPDHINELIREIEPKLGTAEAKPAKRRWGRR